MSERLMIWEDILKSVDKDNDGKISKKEFHDAIEKALHHRNRNVRKGK